MNNHPRLIYAPAAVLVLALAAAAQKPKGEEAVVTMQVSNQPSTVSVDFRGGTLTEFAAALRQAGKNVNIVVPETASKVKVPALVLRETSVEAALRSVTMVVDPTVGLAVETSLGVSSGGPVGEPVYSVRVRLAEPSSVNITAVTGGQPGPRAVRVFAMRHLTRERGTNVQLDMKTILTAIDTGLAIAGEQLEQDTGGPERKALVRLHEDSGLLFVAGTHAQLRVVDEVISNLSNQLMQERGRERPVPASDKPSGEPATEEKKKASR